MKKNSAHLHKKGFILVEMLVAVFLFTIVMLVSMTAVIALLDTNKKNQSTKSVINNLNLAISSMVKNLNVGTKYYCSDIAAEIVSYDGTVGQDCPGGESSMAFRSNKGEIIRYKFIPGTSQSVGQIFKAVNGSSDSAYNPITSSEVDIKNFKFFVFGTETLDVINATTDDTNQPRVVMVINGVAGSKANTQTDFNIQTTASQRKLDATY